MTTVPLISVELHADRHSADLVEEAVHAESLGFHGVWVGDSQLVWRDPYALLTAMASRTSHIRLGVGVTNPVTRHITVVASSIRTIEELAGPRLDIGIGSGFSSVKSIGLEPARLDRMEVDIRGLRALLDGRTYLEGSQQVGLEWPAGPSEAQLLLAASGPKMQTLAGALCDGVVFGPPSNTDEAIPGAVARVRAGMDGRAHQRPFRFVTTPALALDDDPGMAARAVWPHVMRSQGKDAWGGSKSVSDMASQFDMSQAPRHLSDGDVAFARRSAIVGDADHCAQRLMGLAELGCTEATLRIYGRPGESRAAAMTRVASDILPLLVTMPPTAATDRQ